MSIWSTYGLGRVAPGEADVVLLPAAYPQDGSAVGIVYCHPSGGSALNGSSSSSLAGEWNLVRSLAEHHPVVVADLGGPQTFGNVLALSRIGAAAAYLRSAWGAHPGPIVLIGVSMGATAALSYAAGHRPDVLAVVGVVPLIDLDLAYTTDAGGLTNLIATAWGVKPGQPLPERANPARRAAELVGLPFQAWFADDDPAVPVGTVLDLVAAIGPTAEAHDLGTVGHTQAAIAAVDAAVVRGWIDAASAAQPA